jgi:OOP family OmpA-OmpF porin
LEKEKIMMKFIVRYPFLALLAAAFITACATPHHPLPDFDAQQIDPGHYEKKVDHLVFVLDASSSMAGAHRGYQKLDVARGVISNFNHTMPDLDVAVSLHSFGHAPSVSSASSAILMPMRPYSRDALSSAVENVQEAGGISPLARALNDVEATLKIVDTRIAMVIVSDGKDMASGTRAATEALAADHGDRLCIYTVQVGDAADGAMLLGRVAETSGCGEALTAEGIASGQAMNAFVQKVLLTTKKDSDGDGVADDMDRCPDTPRGVEVDANGCPLDSDKDGVSDYKDACPDTPQGTAVDAKGCPIPAAAPAAATTSGVLTDAGTWRYKDIQFENNKAVLKESAYSTLNEITTTLKAQPELKVEIHGHTDGSGARGYNLDLSRKRAASVKAYLESRGIDAGRMSTRGFGPDRPIDSNATQEGRARNRRVEFKPIQ